LFGDFPDMARLSDKSLAERMLRARERGGYRILPFVRMNAKGYIVLVVYFGALLAFFALTAMWSVFAVIAGVVAGVFLRDVSWLIGIQRTWPFSAKVTDWDKVQKIAAGLPIAEPGAAPNAGPTMPQDPSEVSGGPSSVS
jgi:hypothetical protein